MSNKWFCYNLRKINSKMIIVCFFTFTIEEELIDLKKFTAFFTSMILMFTLVPFLSSGIV